MIYGGDIQGGTITTAGGATLRGGPTASSPGALDGVTLAGTLDLSHSASGNISNYDGLTLNNGTILIGTADDTVNYGVLDFSGVQTLGGTGSVVFGANALDSLYTDLGLTIGSGITVHGQTGYIGYNPNYSIQANSTFTNQGTIDADVAGGEITLQGDLQFGSWSSSGTLRAENGATLRLMGTFSNTGLIAAHGGSTILFGDSHGYGATTFALNSGSHYDTAGGTVVIDGTLNNTGHTLTLDSTTGSWSVTYGGTIQGGTITTANGAVLLGDNAGTSSPGYLDGVTLAGTLDLSHTATGGIEFSGGLTLNGGTILIGTAGDAVNYGILTSGTANQTLGGTGTITFGGNVTDSIQSGVGLTIGASILIHGQDGFIGYNPHYSIHPGSTFNLWARSMPTPAAARSPCWRTAGPTPAPWRLITAAPWTLPAPRPTTTPQPAP